MWTRRHFLTALSSGVPSQLADGPFRLTLPLRLRVFHDGAWVVAAGDDASTLLGRRVDAIGRLAVPELIRAFTVEWPGNAAWAHRWSAGALASPAFLQALERRPTPQEDWAKAAGGGNYVRALDDWTCFLSLDDMDDVEGKTFEMLTREVFALFERADTRRLIVDLRRNGGGNNYLGEALRKGIGRAHVNRRGACTCSSALAPSPRRRTWPVGWSARHLRPSSASPPAVHRITMAMPRWLRARPRA